MKLLLKLQIITIKPKYKTKNSIARNIYHRKH